MEKCKVCGKEAFTGQARGATFRDAFTGEVNRVRGYHKIVIGKACKDHGGASRADLAHKGDPCICCGVGHDIVEIGFCSKQLKRYF